MKITLTQLALGSLSLVFIVALYGAGSGASRHSGVDPLPAQENGEFVVVQPVDVYAGRKPVKRIVYPNGECAGVLFEDGSHSGLCDMALVGKLPTTPHDEVLP